MNNILQVVWISAASLAALFLLTKLMGKKQVSQMNVFDYIVGITIGSIAAEMATDIENSPLQPLTAMVVYAVLALLISLITDGSVRAQQIIGGKPTLLFDHGKLYDRNLKRVRIGVEEFLMYCRIGGYFNLGEIETVVMEENGAVSILPKAGNRPAAPADFQMDVRQSYLQPNLVVGGRILRNNLRAAGRDENWLHQQLRAQGCNKIEDVFLAVCDSEGNLAVYLRQKEEKDSGSGIE